MSATRQLKKIATHLSLALACVLTPTLCWAQAYGIEEIVDNNDLRWFEPAELDLDGRIKPEAGFFFSFDKVAWYYTGERATIGQPGLTVNSEVFINTATDDAALQVRVDELAQSGLPGDVIESILGVTLQRDAMTNDFIVNVVTDVGDITDPADDFMFNSFLITPGQSVQALQSYQVQNGIQDAAPDATLGWGERYEFGYSDGERGWRIGILDGPDAISEDVYGAGLGQPGFSPSLTDSTANPPPNVPTVGPVRAFGFGSVAVNFNLPDATFLQGLRNYFDNGLGVQAGTQFGPLYYVGNYQADEEGGGGGNVPIADDVDGDGITGSITVLADLDGDGTVDDDEIVGTVVDNDDLHTFNIFFDQVSVRNTTEMDGVEWMFTHELDRSHLLERGRNDYAQLSYGFRFTRITDEFAVIGDGSILGRTSVLTRADNQMIGPQVGFRWRRDRGKWDFTIDSRAMLGYNIVDVDQEGIFGEEAIPGALNRSATARTTTSVRGQRIDDFSPLAEVRFEARYKLTKAIALKAGYNIMYMDNIRRGSRMTLYNAPDFGIADHTTELIINGLTFGADLRY